MKLAVFREMSGCKLYSCLNSAKREATVCVSDSDKWLPKKIRQRLPVSAVSKPVLQAVKSLASFLSVSSDYEK